MIAPIRNSLRGTFLTRTPLELEGIVDVRSILRKDRLAEEASSTDSILPAPPIL